MQSIWVTGEGVIKDFISKMEGGESTPYTTIASIVRNLERKGYVEARRYGNTNVYRPLVDIAEYKREFMNGVVKDYFTNSYKDMVSFFVEQRHLSKRELMEIIELIEKE